MGEGSNILAQAGTSDLPYSEQVCNYMIANVGELLLLC